MLSDSNLCFNWKRKGRRDRTSLTKELMTQMLGSPGPQGTVQLAALILNDLQRLEVWKISQCLCRDATQLIVLQHPIIRKKENFVKK